MFNNMDKIVKAQNNINNKNDIDNQENIENIEQAITILSLIKEVSDYGDVKLLEKINDEFGHELKQAIPGFESCDPQLISNQIEIAQEGLVSNLWDRFKGRLIKLKNLFKDIEKVTKAQVDEEKFNDKILKGWNKEDLNTALSLVNDIDNYKLPPNSLIDKFSKTEGTYKNMGFTLEDVKKYIVSIIEASVKFGAKLQNTKKAKGSDVVKWEWKSKHVVGKLLVQGNRMVKAIESSKK